MLATSSPKSYLTICNYVRRRRDWLSSGNPILMETIGFVFFFFAGWQGQPVGQSTGPSTQPTGLARQVRQSARSTAHCDKIRETKKQKTKKKPHMYRNWEAVAYPFRWKPLVVGFLVLRDWPDQPVGQSTWPSTHSANWPSQPAQAVSKKHSPLPRNP